MSALDDLGIDVVIDVRPNEVDPAIPFAEDRTSTRPTTRRRRSSSGDSWCNADRVMGEFRSHFVGKVSPVHFFWGAMDLACTRFSGREAPEHPGGAPNCGDWVMVEGYSRELSSAGFWPGGGEEGAFYAYAYPEPDGFAEYPVGPDAAYYSVENGQFLLPYEAVAEAEDPDRDAGGVPAHHLRGRRGPRRLGPAGPGGRSAPVAAAPAQLSAGRARGDEGRRQWMR